MKIEIAILTASNYIKNSDNFNPDQWVNGYTKNAGIKVLLRANQELAFNDVSNLLISLN